MPNRAITAIGISADRNTGHYGKAIRSHCTRRPRNYCRGKPRFEECIEIARGSFTHDRFHADPEISDVAANALKAVWARNSLVGALMSVWSPEMQRNSRFYLLPAGVDYAVIDLIAVAASHRGNGLGSKLVDGALAYYAGTKAIMRVGTQEANWVR